MEIIVRPAQTFAGTHRYGRHLENLVGVIGILVGIVIIIGVIAIAVAIYAAVYGIAPVIIDIRGVNTGLTRIIGTH